jgi:hypothetical protein
MGFRRQRSRTARRLRCLWARRCRRTVLGGGL